MDVLELIGFIASVIIAISLTMSSIVKLRWYNLAGASIFSVYGFLIGSMPVALLNLFISLANIYYLRIIYAKKEHLKILELRPDNYYLDFFLDFYHKDIIKFFPDFPDFRQTLKKETENPLALIILRDAAVAGVVLGKKTSANELFIFLDYVIPQYRDLKPGKFLFEENIEFFQQKNIKVIYAQPKSQHYRNYLKSLGFRENPENEKKAYLVKTIA